MKKHEITAIVGPLVAIVVILGLIAIAFIFPDSFIGQAAIAILLLVLLPAVIIGVVFFYKKREKGTSETGGTKAPKEKRDWQYWLRIVAGLILLLWVGSCTASILNQNDTKKEVETYWQFRRNDTPPNQHGVRVLDRSVMTCEVNDGALRFDMTCQNKYSTEDFTWVKNESWGIWKRRNSNLHGKFSISKVNKDKYMGLAYSSMVGVGDPDIPAPFTLECKAK